MSLVLRDQPKITSITSTLYGLGKKQEERDHHLEIYVHLRKEPLNWMGLGH